MRPDDSDMRLAAVSARIEHYCDDPQTLPLLRDRTVNDTDAGVRQLAVSALIEHFRDSRNLASFASAVEMTTDGIGLNGHTLTARVSSVASHPVRCNP